MFKKCNSVSFQVPKVLYENRYCNQEGFSILICGGYDKNRKITNEVFEIEVPSFKLKRFPSLVNPQLYLNLVNMKSDVIAFDNRSTNLNRSLDELAVSVEIYSGKTKTWTHQHVKMNERSHYCVSSFMGKMYIIGRLIISRHKSRSSCNTYDINNNTLNKIADLNEARHYAASTVFEGKVVVTGGEKSWYTLKSVETYDYYENKWTYLPDMIETRFNHAAVSMGNKMFVIGGSHKTSCEVFDSFSRKFTKINSEISDLNSKQWYFYT